MPVRHRGDSHLSMTPPKQAMLAALWLVAAACSPQATITPSASQPTEVVPAVRPTPLPQRTLFPPGQVFDYLAQPGDTLPAVAAHFNTTEAEIRSENPLLPDPVTTIPAGYLLRVPAYYVPLTSSSFHILPDSEAVNGPGAVGFDTRVEDESHPGYLS